MFKILTMILVTVSIWSYPVTPVLSEEMEAQEMKVNFYRLDKIKKERGEYLGFAELKNNELVYKVNDRRLARILKGDFHTEKVVEEKGRKALKFVTYKVGTPEHLQMVIDNCPDIGCVAEVVEKGKD